MITITTKMTRLYYWTGHFLLYMLTAMQLVQALKSGKVASISELPINHIETVMSHVLIYKDTVRKVYKDDREGIFLDLRDFETRKQFYKDDFYWNQDVSPHIHLNLHGVEKDTQGTYKIIAAENASEWFVEMRRIEDTDTLVKRLLEETITTTDIEAVAETQIKGLKKLSEKWLPSYEDLLSKSLQKLWADRLDTDLRNFGYSFGKEIPKETTDIRIHTLLNFFNTHTYFNDLKEEDAEIAIDNHAGNVVFTDGAPHFIDIYLIKKEWRVIDRNNNIARLATCIRVLGNDNLADSVYNTFNKHHTLASSEVYDFLEAYNALIKGYYYTYLQQPNIAEKYFIFADKTLKNLSQF